MTPLDLTKSQRAEVFRKNVEKDDCGVIAISTALSLPYDEALDLAREYGYGSEARARDGRTGMERYDIWLAIGTKARVEEVEVGRRATPASFANTHQVGTFLIHTQGHVAVLKDGDLYNSDGSWSAPLEVALEVTPL